MRESVTAAEATTRRGQSPAYNVQRMGFDIVFRLLGPAAAARVTHMLRTVQRAFRASSVSGVLSFVLAALKLPRTNLWPYSLGATST
jgi:hypothetical protein